MSEQQDGILSMASTDSISNVVIRPPSFAATASNQVSPVSAVSAEQQQRPKLQTQKSDSFISSFFASVPQRRSNSFQARKPVAVIAHALKGTKSTGDVSASNNTQMPGGMPQHNTAPAAREIMQHTDTNVSGKVDQSTLPPAETQKNSVKAAQKTVSDIRRPPALQHLGHSPTAAEGGAIKTNFSSLDTPTPKRSNQNCTIVAGDSMSPSRAGKRSEATQDYVKVDEDGDEIHGTLKIPNVAKMLARMKKNMEKVGLAAPKSTAASNNLMTDLVSPASAAAAAGEIPTKVPAAQGTSGMLQRMIMALPSAGLVHIALFASMAFGLVYGVYSNRYKFTDMDLLVDWTQDLNVAFIGNAYLFVNDIPRLMQSISDGHIHQQSVIHSSAGSLAGILLTGNGMYKQWKTDEAFLEIYQNSYGNNETIYDFGLCTVAQILLGYDEILSYKNMGGAYYNDGKNPCIMDRSYMEYVGELLYNNNQSYVNWDYVVLVDQTKRMAIKSARQETIYSLANAYGPLLASSGAIPVIVDTHSFWSEDTNMTGLESVEYFQSLIYDGVEDYVNALANVLPEWQYPVVAPIGIAYLTVYHERPGLWEKLFIDDKMHSSVHGSYLFACVLYATLYGHLPDKHRSVDKVEYLFADSRKLVGKLEYPTETEAYYYRNVARRVALRGYVPISLRN